LLDITLVLLAAGNSTRFECGVKKQWLYSGESPLWVNVAKHFSKMYSFDKIIIVSPKDDIEIMRNFGPYQFVVGGETRHASVKNALAHVSTTHVLVSDIARCCVPFEMVNRIIEAKKSADCIVPTLPTIDTLYGENGPIDREKIRRVQTPQLSVTKMLKEALNDARIFTDESSAISSFGGNVHFVEGSDKALKLTTIHDLKSMHCLKEPSQKTRTGFGIDTHPFENGKEMFLCGLQIESDFGFKAHSDGDVAIHAIIDALLGAAGMGDIGELYPDNDSNYKGVDSKILLKNTVSKIKQFGFEIGNIDMTILAEVPKISPHKTEMRQLLARLLEIEPHLINIKATTSEKLGFIGHKEGVTVHAVANLTYYNWKNV